MKKQYFVTAEAGKTVAGMPSPGAGKAVLLTESQAEHPLRLGHISEVNPLDHDANGKKGGSKPRQTLSDVDA